MSNLLKFSLLLMKLCWSETIRGVPPDRLHLYNKDVNKFVCLQSHKSFPRKYLNDDYCDCTDGTDEPGTSACENGRFYCVAPHIILGRQDFPSSRINDFFCDCCDGSDEYLGKVECNNTCGSTNVEKILRSHQQTQRALTEHPWAELIILISVTTSILLVCLCLFCRKRRRNRVSYRHG